MPHEPEAFGGGEIVPDLAPLCAGCIENRVPAYIENRSLLDRLADPAREQPGRAYRPAREIAMRILRTGGMSAGSQAASGDRGNRSLMPPVQKRGDHIGGCQAVADDENRI